MDNPLVSTIIPVYNGEQFIAEAIDSVLTQTYQPIEIIVVDDGSDDKSREIIKSYQTVTYIFQENLGNGAARNTGIQKSNGDFLAFLDQDDLWIPQKIKTQIDYLIKNPDIGYVACNMKNFIQSGCSLSKDISDIYTEDEQVAYIPSGILIRRKIIEEVGKFNPDMLEANDTDWHFRAKDKGIRMANVNKLLLYRRIHGSNLSHHRGLESRAVNELLQAVRDSVHRKQNQTKRKE
jgi:glycosyltransferase involved in cell wall biosynthesis